MSFVGSDSYVYPGGQGNGYAFGSDSLGKLYTAGLGLDGSGTNHWVVRKQTAGVWGNVDDFVYSGGTNSIAYGFAKDSSGNLFVVGTGTDGGGNYHWLVRESQNQGTTWTTIDDYVYSGSTGISVSGITVDTSGNIYVIGTINVSGTYIWLVRESQNDGATWNNADTYVYSAGGHGNGSALLTDTHGNVFATGRGMTSAFVAHWITRLQTCD